MPTAIRLSSFSNADDSAASDQREQPGQHSPTEQEAGEPDRVGPQPSLDLHGVDASPPQQHVLLAAPHRVGLASLVQPANVAGQVVLVAADDPSRHQLHEVSDDRLERPQQARHRRPSHTVAVEHLERPHRHPVRFTELARLPQGPDFRELVDDVLLDLARPTDLLEQATLLLW